MTTILPATWRNKTEPSLDDIDRELRSRIAEITTAAQEIAKTTGDLQTEKAIKAVEDIYSLATATNSSKSYAQSKSWETLKDRLSDFGNELALWRRMLASFISNEAKQNARTRFSDMTTWATHFSMVRMTLSTFFITAAWGLVTLKWSEYSDGLWYASVAAWSFAGIFLLLFTWALHEASGKRGHFKLLIGGSSPEAAFPWAKLTLGIICAVTGLFWLIVHVTHWPGFGPTWLPIALSLLGALLLAIAIGNNWGPVVVYVFMSIGFGHLLHVWEKHTPKTTITWTSLVDPSSIEKKRTEAGVTTLKVPDLGAKLDKLKESVDQVALKLPPPLQIVPPTPTPTATPTAAPKSKPPPRHRRGGHRPGG